MVLDKTGTITSGKLKVEEVGGYQSDFPADAMMQIAAALEKKSEHPLAEAVVEYAESFQMTIPEIVDFKATFGRGVEGALAADFHAEKVAKKDGPTAVFYAGKGIVLRMYRKIQARSQNRIRQPELQDQMQTV